MLTEVLFAQKALKALFGPAQAGGLDGGHEVSAPLALLGNVLDQPLGITLPSEFAPGPPRNRAAARASFAADGDRQRCGRLGEGRCWSPVTLKTVTRHVAHQVRLRGQ